MILAKELGQLNPFWHQLATRIQPKLAVSAPDDLYEREADMVADRIIQMPAPAVQRSCATCAAGSAPCPQCEEEQKKDPPAIHRKSHDFGDVQTSLPDEFLSKLGPGQPLDRTTRNFMGPRFGRHFGSVRVHTDERAAQSAQSLNAQAYAAGHDLVFAAGRYDPATRAVVVGARTGAHSTAAIEFFRQPHTSLSRCEGVGEKHEELGCNRRTSRRARRKGYA